MSERMIAVKRAVRLACELLRSESLVAEISHASATDVASWRNPETDQLPSIIQCAAIDTACIARGAARAPFFETYATFLDENHDQRPIKSVDMMRATLDLQRQVGALAQSMFAATASESEAGEDIGPGERAEVQQQLEDIAASSARLQMIAGQRRVDG
ncbi:MAG: hypothetical protein Hens3KO_20200 [Henriciella sp.]